MINRLTRRSVLRTTGAAIVATRIRPATAQTPSPAFSYPLAMPGRAPGDGFVIRHGYATENTWYLPGYWHTGEDWYAIEGDTAGAAVLAVSSGEVVFAGYDYPGPVVIVRHAEDLYSMYGHLDDDLQIGVGSKVERGQILGTVLPRTDGRAPSHLHFEIRSFLTTPEVNGDAPRYGFACGFHCPPGPGYWPIADPDHPSDLGWRNPTHTLAHRAFSVGSIPPGTEVAVAGTPPSAIDVWSAPMSDSGAERLATLTVRPGERLPLIAVRVGAEDSRGTSAEAYELWYQVELPDNLTGWIQAAVPSTSDTGADGRPSGVRFTLYPLVSAK
jgi:murein DD-endopeptidase MepM/ murein hydrolase activator NlpD